MIKLGNSSEFKEGQSRGFTLGDLNIFVIRRDGRLYAYENRCPHLGTPLEWMPDKFLDYEGELIQCSTHGALFVIESGECVSGPCLGDHLSSHNILERDNTVFLAG